MTQCRLPKKALELTQGCQTSIKGQMKLGVPARKIALKLDSKKFGRSDIQMTVHRDVSLL
jgi:hypothetical protein